MFISFFTGKVMLFYGISLIMKEKSNASALTRDEARPNAGRDTSERRRAFAIKYRDRIGLPSFLNIRKGLTSEYGSQSFRLLGVDGWED